jgi:hypothetical protein
VFTHVAVVVLADQGPHPLLNIKGTVDIDFDLDEVELMKLGISGMTSIGLGTGILVARDRLHGSFPVPDRTDLASLVFPFNVKAEGTTDHRVDHFGREVLVFLLFSMIKRNDIFALYGEIEKMIALAVKNIKAESEIKEQIFTKLLTNLNEMLLQAKPTPEKAMHDAERVNEITSEIKFLQEVIDLKLRDQENPILSKDKDSHLCEDFLANEEDAEKLYDLVKELLKIDFNATLEHVRPTSLYRIGNYHYQMARYSGDKSAADMHVERSLKYYRLACSIRDDPLIRLSIGSLLFKRANDMMARENVKLGLKLLHEAGLDESVLNEIEIYEKEI